MLVIKTIKYGKVWKEHLDFYVVGENKMHKSHRNTHFFKIENESFILIFSELPGGGGADEFAVCLTCENVVSTRSLLTV